MHNFLKKICKVIVSCEDAATEYICLPGVRLIYRSGKYEGWYRP